MELEINKEILEKLGSASLEGMLATSGVVEPQEITLRFRQTSYAWRQEHGGPDIYLVPEFAPFCLVESILNLQAKGYKISIEWFEG